MGLSLGGKRMMALGFGSCGCAVPMTEFLCLLERAAGKTWPFPSMLTNGLHYGGGYKVVGPPMASDVLLSMALTCTALSATGLPCH